MIYGLIISAGKQRRFNDEIPKALAKICNETLLDINIKHMEKYCDNVYVICNSENKKYFENYNFIVIDSGYGCGDAVLKAIEKIKICDDDTIFIQWGDSMHKPIIYETLINNIENNKIIIPCIIEEKPYVQIKENDGKIIVNFSKYNEHITKGYHDLSLFYGNAKYLLHFLQVFRNKIKTENGYIHKHNNEMQFLDVFNETDINGKILDMGDYKDFSFNTINELHNKINEIQKK